MPSGQSEDIHFHSRAHARGLAVKRLFDIAFALFFLTLTFPIMFIAVFAVMLTSRGPAFFFQERVGKDEETFTMFKLRSMNVDAEQQFASVEHLNELSGPVFKVHNDPRITWVGSVLRKYSIDELPQLVNVLRGEMSIVGPRPHIAREVARYSLLDRRRMDMKPGMTGLAQVSGRSRLSWEDTIRYDLHYIDSWGIALDVNVIVRTVKTVATATGA